MQILSAEFVSFSDEEIKKMMYLKTDISSDKEVTEGLLDLIAIFDHKSKADKWNAGGAHEILTQIIRYIGMEIPRCCGDDMGYILARDGMLIPLDEMCIPDRGDEFLPSHHEHFLFYEKIVDADEFANFRK